MTLTKLIALISLLIFCISTATTPIPMTQPKNITIELGQQFSTVIPTFFNLYQQVYTQPLTKPDNSNIQQQSTQQPQINCQFIQRNDSYFQTKSVLYHYGLADPDMYFIGNKKVFKFADLKKLIGVLDVALFQGQVVVIFQSGYYAFYLINEKGDLSLKETKRLGSSKEITDPFNLEYSVQHMNYWGNFVQNAENLIFMAQNTAYIFNKEKRVLQTLFGYEPIMGYSLQKAILVNDRLYVAAGQKGIAVYTVKFNQKRLVFKNEYLPVIPNYDVRPIVSSEQLKLDDFWNTLDLDDDLDDDLDINGTLNDDDLEDDQDDQDEQTISKKKQVWEYTSKQLTYLNVADIVYDQNSQQFIITDEQEGIYWLSIPQNQTQELILCQQLSIFIEGCTNLQLISEKNLLFITCPYMVQVDLIKKTHIIFQDIDFYTRAVVLNESRLYFFGEQSFAVYDAQTNVVMTGTTEHTVEHFLIVGQWIVIINKFNIAVGDIEPQVLVMQCKTEKDQRGLIGLNHAKLIVQGFCSHITPEQTMSTNSSNSVFIPSSEDFTLLSSYEKKSFTGLCQVSYPVNFIITDSSQQSHPVTYAIIALVVLAAVIVVIYLFLTNRKISKEYEKLVEENKRVQVADNIISAYNIADADKNDL